MTLPHLTTEERIKRLRELLGRIPALPWSNPDQRGGRIYSNDEIGSLVARVSEHWNYLQTQSIANLIVEAINSLPGILDDLEAARSAAGCCWTCGGSPHPSGLTCVCNGTGSHTEEVAGLRIAVVDARDKFAELRRKIQVAEDALELVSLHLLELREAWTAGALSSHDGRNGIRSKCNLEAYSKARAALAELRAK